MPAESMDQPSKASASGRLTALDVMRGITILAMILVSNPGSWDALYPPISHAHWHGITPTDLVFPFFLFMVGVSMAYSFKKYVAKEEEGGGQSPDRAVFIRIGRRVLLLILLGLLHNGSGALFNFLLGNDSSLHLDTLRWPGVLQRIGVAYLFASLIVLSVGRRGQIVLAVLLQFGYWAMLAGLPVGVAPAERMEESSNIVRVVDQAVIGQQHLWGQRLTDPEGLLSTLPAIVSILFGFRVGSALRKRTDSGKVIGLQSCVKLTWIGCLLAGTGWFFGHDNLLGLVMPINKSLWTPTFVMFSTGCAFITLAACLLLFDVFGKQSKRLQKIGTAFQMVGVNAIFAYVASGVVSKLLSTLKIGDVSVKEWIYQNVYIQPLGAIGFEDVRLASLMYSIAWVACWWLILWAMWRRGWSVRV